MRALYMRMRADTDESVSRFTRERVTMNFTVGNRLCFPNIYAVLAAGFDNVKRSNLIRELVGYVYTAQPYLYILFT